MEEDRSEEHTESRLKPAGRRSIRANYVYNSLLTALNIVYPLFTFPIVSRAIGPGGVGAVNLAATIAGYFSMFAALGIPMYGMREIARQRDDPAKLRRAFSELFLVGLAATGASTVAYVVFVASVGKAREALLLYIVVGASIPLNGSFIEWLYQGLEQYKLIAVRSAIVKVFAVVVIVLAVRTPKDYIVYAAISSGSLGLNNLFNLFYSRRLVRFDFRNIEIGHHIKIALRFILMNLLASGYTAFDKILLGFLAGDRYVGYYIPADRLARLAIGVVTSVSAVVFPRLSNYFSSNKDAEFRELLRKTVYFVAMLSLPATVGLFMISHDVVLVFAGAQFGPSVPTLRIMSLVVIPVCLATIAGIQVLVATGKETKYLLSMAIALVASIVLDVLLIPPMKQQGAATAMVFAEILGVSLELYFGWTYFRGVFTWSRLSNYLVGCLLMGLAVEGVELLPVGNHVIRLLVEVVAGVIVYGGYLRVRRDPLFTDALRTVQSAIARIHRSEASD